MPIVIVSAVTFSRGEEIAAKAAGLLGYPCLGPDILQEAAQKFGLPLSKVTRAVRETSTFRPMSMLERRKTLALIEATLLETLSTGDAVCHGLAAHLYISGISHAIKVRITAPMDQRVRSRMELEDVPEAKARKLIVSQDKLRRSWVGLLFRLFEDDPNLYDLALDLGKMNFDQAVSSIVELAGRRKFQAMTYSRRRWQEKVLAAKVRAALVSTDPEVLVRADDGRIFIQTPGFNRAKIAALKDQILSMDGVKEVNINLMTDSLVPIEQQVK